MTKKKVSTTSTTAQNVKTVAKQEASVAQNVNGDAKSQADTEKSSEDTEETKKATLLKLEKQIRRAITSFRKMGSQLFQINEEKLYLTVEYDDFNTYCEKRLHLSSAHAYRLIAHYVLCEKVLSENYLNIPEKVTRPLSALNDDKDKIAIWTAAKKARNGKIPTGHDVEVRVQELKDQRDGKIASEDEIFVKKLNKAVKKDQLADELIKGTATAYDLIGLTVELLENITDKEEVIKLKMECTKRLESVFLSSKSAA